ncbi:MAG: aldo/keto reductase [Spirochaetales bacterium]|nr:MAG: aldo/keto reductase [Spirochaetales bacterium]
MQYRTFPKIPGLKVSALGLGMMRLPTVEGDQGRIDEERALDIVRAALDAGVNYIDTAWSYHNGESERFTGRALRSLGAREKVYVATKAPIWHIDKRGDWDRYLDEQLERLQDAHIDFYLVHALSAPRWETFLRTGGIEALQAAKADGRIKHVGFSFHDSLSAFKTIVDGWDGWEFCQVQYNYVDEDYQAGAEGIEYASAKGLGVIVMEPLRGGALAKVPDEVKAIFASWGKPRMAAEWALRHVLDRQDVVTTLSGMGSVDQLWENAAVASAAGMNAITAGERAVLDCARAWFLERMAVPCTTCGYCKPCPSGVAIPEIFELWNTVTVFGDRTGRSSWYKSAYASKGNGADACTECGACLPKCPQGIAIPDRLREALLALT